MKDWHNIIALLATLGTIIALILTGHDSPQYLTPLYSILGVIFGTKLGTTIK